MAPSIKNAATPNKNIIHSKVSQRGEEKNNTKMENMIMEMIP
jgi:hypothetical protein